MLIELTKSKLAEELAGANTSIVELLQRAASAEEVSYDEAMANWTHPGKPARAKVKAVLALSRDDRAALADAVAVDLGFETGGKGFEFAFLSLAEAVQKVGKELMGSMYEDVFRNSSFQLDSGEQANRRTWEDAFRAANPDLRVCPACLAGLLETRINGRSAIDLDHYLPKSIYPPLAVHGPNLVPLCSRCNSRAKGETDPLADGAERRELTSIWLPYTDAGLDESRLAFEVIGENETLVRLEGIGKGKPRAEHFDSLYFLSKLWSEQLEGVHNSICIDIRARGLPLEAEAIRKELGIKATAAAAARLVREGSLLIEYYCRWLLSEPRALENFISSLAKFPTPPPATEP